jgi:hypothetical protein
MVVSSKLEVVSSELEVVSRELMVVSSELDVLSSELQFRTTICCRPCSVRWLYIAKFEKIDFPDLADCG